MIIVIIVILGSILILGKYWFIGFGLGIIFSIYYIISEKIKSDKIWYERQKSCGIYTDRDYKDAINNFKKDIKNISQEHRQELIEKYKNEINENQKLLEPLEKEYNLLPFQYRSITYFSHYNIYNNYKYKNKIYKKYLQLLSF